MDPVDMNLSEEIALPDGDLASSENEIAAIGEASAGEDLPADLQLERNDSEWLSISLSLLYGQAFTLAEQGIGGQALADALTRYNQTLRPPIDDDRLQLVIEGGQESVVEQAGTPVPTLDDAIASGKVELLYECVRELAELKTMTPLSYAIKKNAIKAAFGKTVNLNDLERAVNALCRKAEQQRRGEKLDVADVARYWAMANRQDWAYDGRAKLWRHWNDCYWEELEERSAALELEAVGALHDAEIDINSSNGINCFQRVAAAELTTIFTEGTGKINFENGTLDLSTMRIGPFNREDRLTYCLPYQYTVGKHPTINRFLKEAIPDVHARQAYMAHLGLALLRDTSLHYVLLLLGPTRSGKTTLLALANALCGTSPANNFAEDFSFAGPSLFSRELEGKRSRFQWGHRRLVCADEIPAEALKDEELFKTMAAHGGVEKRGMHKDELIGNQWKPKLILAANDRPRYKDVAGAVKERSIFISCPNHRPRGSRDPQLFARMRAEIGAFAASCLVLARRLLERTYYPMSNAMKHLLETIAREGSHVKTFVAEQCIVSDPTDWTVSEDVYAAYTSFCTNAGITQGKLARHMLSATICNMGLGISAKRGRNDHNKVVCGLSGLRLRGEQDPWINDEEELSRLSDDTLLIGQDEVLMPVDGLLLVVPKAINNENKPEKPLDEGMLMVLMAEEGISAENTTPSFETTKTILVQGEGVSSGGEKTGEEPSTTTTDPIEPPVALAESVDGSEMTPSTDPQQPATREVLAEDPFVPSVQYSTAYQCGVQGCLAPIVVHDPEQIEEEERTMGLWCDAHQSRYETMALGELLDPAYPRVQYCASSALCEGREAWRRFHQHPLASVEAVNASVRQLVEERFAQEEETA